MKKITTFFAVALLCFQVKAQNGLENIIVEKYYVSEANDAAANSIGGVLPVNSVTYRIFADMLPGYKFQAAYGVSTASGSHELRIATTTKFFNNEDYGSTQPTFTKIQAKKNTVMLDSWLSVGAACSGSYGVLKSEDNGVATVVNNYTPQVLQGSNPNAGIPLTQQDGILTVTGSQINQVTTVGFTANELALFDNTNTASAPHIFSTTNASWASLTGSKGPDSLSNKVLIAQLTTDGVLTFELNIQIGTPTGGVENYVANNPTGNEIQKASLTYDSSILTSLFDSDNNYTSISVYPNPVKNDLIVEINTTKISNVVNSYSIYSLEGNLVAKNVLNNSKGLSKDSIDVSGLSNGMYFIELKVNGNALTRKFIKI